MVSRKSAEERIIKILEENGARLSARYFYPLKKVKAGLPGVTNIYKRMAGEGRLYYAPGLNPKDKSLSAVIFLSLNDLNLPPQTDRNLCFIGRDGHILSEQAGRKLEVLISKYEKQKPEPKL